MKICIPIPVRAEGGMHTFLGQFKDWLVTHGHEVTDSWVDTATCDVLFVNSWAVPYHKIARAKGQNSALIVTQRVDGSSRDYGRLDASDHIQGRVSMLADVVIFQSEYSKKATTEKFKLIEKDGPIILNPVDLALFHPSTTRQPPEKSEKIKLVNVTFSLNKMKGTWQIPQFARANPDVEFHLIGRYPFEGTPEEKLPNIILHGHQDRAGVARLMRDAHVHLQLSENDPCPNAVIEALASGLPVLYKDSGGVPELVANCGRPLEEADFRSCLNALLHEWPVLHKTARTRAEKAFAQDAAFPQYLTAMEAASRQPLPTFADKIRRVGNGYPAFPALAEIRQQIKGWIS